MNRRKALRNVALTVGSVVSIPAWANAWTPESLPEIKNISTENAKLLNMLVEALIPKTDTPGAAAPGAAAPGAGEMEVDKFVMAMVNDCTPDNQRSTFTTQLGLVDKFSMEKYNESFAELSAEKKTECISMISMNEAPSWRSFFGTLKRYTVQGYQSSEYIMYENGFQFAPGFYNGCVDLVKS
jgi:hypothetical protein